MILANCRMIQWSPKLFLVCWTKCLADIRCSAEHFYSLQWLFSSMLAQTGGQTDRRRHIRAHNAWAQVGSKIREATSMAHGLIKNVKLHFLENLNKKSKQKLLVTHYRGTPFSHVLIRQLKAKTLMILVNWLTASSTAHFCNEDIFFQMLKC